MDKEQYEWNQRLKQYEWYQILIDRRKRRLAQSNNGLDITDAYWISPSGKIAPVDTTHIQAILENPVAFGFVLSDIEEIYKSYDEQIGDEGEARDTVIGELVNKNWIRIRYFPEDNNFFVELNSLTNCKKDYLKEWALQLIKKDESDRSVTVAQTDKDDVDLYSLIAISQDVLYSGIEIPNTREKLFIVSSTLEYKDGGV